MCAFWYFFPIYWVSVSLSLSSFFLLYISWLLAGWLAGWVYWFDEPSTINRFAQVCEYMRVNECTIFPLSIFRPSVIICFTFIFSIQLLQNIMRIYTYNYKAIFARLLAHIGPLSYRGLLHEMETKREAQKGLPKL